METELLDLKQFDNRSSALTQCVLFPSVHETVCVIEEKKKHVMAEWKK